LTQNLEQLPGDPVPCLALGQAGRRYVEQHHDWREIVERLEGTYEEAIVREKS